tara:strand:+ start:15539 stop:16114 length:576 start_codon:yes stop_codon:yes gene_type:complete
MSSLTTNIAKLNKNNIGGVQKVYLFPFVNYSYSQITVLLQKLTVFPPTTAYEYYSTVTGYNETHEIEGGDVAFNQNFSLQFPITKPLSEIHTLVKQEYRAVYIDRLGNIRILGLYNGLTASIENTTGVNKEDMNGFTVSFSGKEDNQAYYIDDLGLTGISIFDPYLNVNNYIFDNCNNYVFEDGVNYIFNN